MKGKASDRELGGQLVLSAGWHTVRGQEGDRLLPPGKSDGVYCWKLSLTDLVSVLERVSSHSADNRRSVPLLSQCNCRQWFTGRVPDFVRWLPRSPGSFSLTW